MDNIDIRWHRQTDQPLAPAVKGYKGCTLSNINFFLILFLFLTKTTLKKPIFPLKPNNSEMFKKHLITVAVLSGYEQFSKRPGNPCLSDSGCLVRQPGARTSQTHLKFFQGILLYGFRSPKSEYDSNSIVQLLFFVPLDHK